jgi:hypothetical protein
LGWAQQRTNSNLTRSSTVNLKFNAWQTCSSDLIETLGEPKSFITCIVSATVALRQQAGAKTFSPVWLD